jgi:hypothetical protein
MTLSLTDTFSTFSRIITSAGKQESQEVKRTFDRNQQSRDRINQMQPRAGGKGRLLPGSAGLGSAGCCLAV